MSTKDDVEKLFSRLNFTDAIKDLTRAFVKFGDAFEDFGVPKKTPLQEFADQVFAGEQPEQPKLDRYADYKEMDEFPMIQNVLGGYSDEASPARTPLQEFTEEVWRDE